jgi:nitrogen fixation/metabolism regulation signal transduction histidine kinase
LDARQAIHRPAASSLPVDRHKLITTFETTTANLDDLLRQLLVLSREGVLPDPQYHDVALRTLVEDIRDAAGLQHPDVVILIEMPSTIVVRGDETYLRLAVKSALQNAIEALVRQPARYPKQICIRAWRTVDTTLLRIEDTGPGFPDTIIQTASIQRLQDMFGWTNKAGGHGLGIAVMSQVVTLHAGRFTFGNQHSRGAWVQFELPAPPIDAAAPS